MGFFRRLATRRSGGRNKAAKASEQPYEFGTALSFNGTSNYVTFADTAAITPSTAWTFACWLYWDLKSADRCIASKWDYDGASGGVFYLGSTGDSGNPFGMYIVASLADGGTNSGKLPAAVITQGAWHHMAWVYDGSQSGNDNRLKAYVNGAPQTLTFAGTIPATLMDVEHELVFGSWKLTGSRTRFWNGDLDEIVWCNQACTQDEITRMYNRLTVSHSAAWWRLNEGSGIVANDSIGTSHGSISGATYVNHT